MENKLIAQALLEIAKRAETIFIESGEMKQRLNLIFLNKYTAALE
jgi:hypothetical protein